LGFITGHVFVDGCGLSAVDRLTLVMCASWADRSGESIHPGVDALRDATGASESTVKRSLGRLVRAGMLEDTGGRRGRTGRVRVFRMLLPPGTASAAWPKHWSHSESGQSDPITGSTPAVPVEPPSNEVTVTGLNEVTVTGLPEAVREPNEVIHDTQSGHPRHSAPLIGTTQGTTKTETSLRSVSASDEPTQPADDLAAELLEPASDLLLRLRMRTSGATEFPDTPWMFRTRHGRRRDLLWEAMLEVTGVAPADLTRKARESLNAAVGEIREVGGSPRQVLIRARRYVTVFGHRPPAHHLAQKWAELGDASEDRFSRADRRVADAAAKVARAVGALP
jgi:hypothetical protein